MNWKQRLGVKLRKIEEIQQEYNNVCAHLGSVNYRLHIIGEDYERVKAELQAQVAKHTAKLKELATEAEAANRGDADNKPVESAMPPQEEV